MVVTYDEHGGFFDHVSPPALRTDPPPGALYQRAFETLYPASHPPPGVTSKLSPTEEYSPVQAFAKSDTPC
jgi:phospholipase C